MTIENFALIMIGFGVLISLVGLIYVIRRAFSRQAGEMGGWETAGARQIITAVARTTLAEGLRTRIASGFVILVVLSIPFFYLTAEGDGTTKGRLQMFMTYSLGFNWFLLALLSILFACRSLSHEIAGRQIFGIVSKPVPRWQIVIGKFTGVMLLNLLLLTYVGITTYAGTQALIYSFKSNLRSELQSYATFTPAQAEAAVNALDNVRGAGREGIESPIMTAMSNATGFSRTQLADLLVRLPEPTRADLRRFDELRRQVLVARAAITPELPEAEIKKAVDERVQMMKDEGNLPLNMSEREVREEIDKQIFSRYCTVTTLETRMWTFKGPPPPKGRDLIMSIRYKMNAAQTIQAAVHPETGDKLEENTLLSIWGVGNPQRASFFQYVDAVPVEAAKEIEFPMEAVEPDGTVRLEFTNIDPRGIDVVFDLDIKPYTKKTRALEVLYVIGSFEWNLLMGCLATLIPLACLTAFGVCASTFLSFPVGALFVVCLFLIANSMEFVQEAMAITSEYVGDNPTWDVEIRRSVINGMGWILGMGDIPVTDNLMEGRAISWPMLWSDTWRYLLLKTNIALLVAVLVFRRRELAAVIV